MTDRHIGPLLRVIEGGDKQEPVPAYLDTKRREFLIRDQHLFLEELRGYGMNTDVCDQVESHQYTFDELVDQYSRVLDTSRNFAEITDEIQRIVDHLELLVTIYRLCITFENGSQDPDTASFDKQQAQSEIDDSSLDDISKAALHHILEASSPHVAGLTFEVRYGVLTFNQPTLSQGEYLSRQCDFLQKLENAGLDISLYIDHMTRGRTIEDTVTLLREKLIRSERAEMRLAFMQAMNILTVHNFCQELTVSDLSLPEVADKKRMVQLKILAEKYLSTDEKAILLKVLSETTSEVEAIDDELIGQIITQLRIRARRQGHRRSSLRTVK